MRRLVLLLVAALLCALAVAPASDAAAAKKKRVCVVKVVKKATKTRKAVRKKVCRAAKKKPAAATKKPASTRTPALAPRPWIDAPVSGPAPAPAAPASPASGSPAPSAPSAPSGLPPADVPVTPVAEPATPVCEDDSMWLGAFAREDVANGFRIDLSRTCIRAGRAIVRYLNTDQTTHNLYVRGIAPSAAPRKVVGAVLPKSQDTGETPGQQDGTVDLTAGEWRFYCAIPGHEVMTRDITVTRAG